MENEVLLACYGWSADADVEMLQDAENTTYRVQDGSERFIVRKYRKNRYAPDEALAELAWIERLQGMIAVPTVVRNREEETLTVLEDGTMLAAFRFLDHAELETHEAEHYHQLGVLLRQFHEAVNAVTEQAEPGWVGWKRQSFDQETLVRQPLERLLAADFFEEGDRERCRMLADALLERWPSFPVQFVHADLHFGNVLMTGNGWVLLDFDETGFGPQVMDLSVIRYHLRDRNGNPEHWQAFLRGYGERFTEEEIRIGTALRLFYMCGKIPLRLDIEMLRKNAAGIIRKFIGYAEEELLGKA